MKIIYYNSKFLKENKFFINQNNRSFNYADGFFETVRIVNKKPFNFNIHYSRFLLACNVLKLINSISLNNLKIILKKLITINKIDDGYAKIHVCRKEGGKYLPNSNDINILITSFKSKSYSLNKLVSICLYTDEQKKISKLSNIKSINKIVPVLSSIYAKNNNVDNALLINTNGIIIEASNSNIFIVIKDIIFTPPEEDGPVLGTMREWVINNIEVKYKSLTKENILEADEIFLTNSISGITGVSKLNNYNKKFKNKISIKLQKKLINSYLD